jgi:uncharacterized protein (DUF2236 family)
MDGYFSPHGMAWRVTREGILLLGGGRALLMQAADPLAMAGFARHSNYRESPWRRLQRTVEAMWTVVYGTTAQAELAAAQVRAIHSRVKGLLPWRAGPYPAGTPYAADDPELLMWVHATLIDTALLMYRTYVGPLSEREQEAYYQETKTMARLFGTPDRVIPLTLADFRAYIRDRLESDEICVIDEAREAARAVLHPPLPFALRPVLRPAWAAVNLITIGHLPWKLRRQYGFGWERPRRMALAASAQYVRRVVLPTLPDMVRALPRARQAERDRAAGLAGSRR